MSLDDSLKSLGKGAYKLADKLGEFQGSIEDFSAIAVSKIYDESIGLLLYNLEFAIQASKEYEIPEFAGPLYNAFQKEGILTFSTEGNVRINAEEFAGSWADLHAGIEFARESLGLGRLSPAKAAQFWRERIYGPARLGSAGSFFHKKEGFDYGSYGIMKYRETIGLRLQNWGSLAPYWLWLEYGNAGNGAYPTVPPTHFVERSRKEIIELYKEALIRTSEEISGLISQEIEDFLRYPEGYEPGYNFEVVEARGRKYRIYVTKVGGLGIGRV